MKKKILLSVVIPCKNSERNLQKTLNSLKRQKSFFEVIFVYTKSNDRTLSILENFNFKNIHKKIIKKNCGISDALNSGIKLSRGKFIMWIGSDDIILDGFLKKITKKIENKKNISWIITQTKIYSKKKRLKKFIEQYKLNKLKKLTFNTLLTENPISAPGVIWSKKFYKKIGKFKKNLKFNSDYDMWLRMYYKDKPIVLGIFSTYYNRHSSSLSSKFFIKQFIEQFEVSNNYKEKDFIKKVIHIFKILGIIIVYKLFNY